MSDQLLEIPLGIDDQADDGGDSRNHLMCECGTRVSLCGVHIPSPVMEDDYAEEADCCLDCWSVYEKGWQCAKCGQRYHPSAHL